MKGIDLLNKIANGEEVPLIKYRDKILHWNKENDRFEDKDGMNTLYEIDFSELNEKVEIIEDEKKIPEKLDLYEETQNIIRENNYKIVYHDIHKCIVSLECKYNQLLDYLKSKGE